MTRKLDVEQKLKQLEKVALQIEKMRLGDYVANLNRPSKIILNNLIGGISKGVGLTVGATLVIALLFKILSVIISMNIPYLTDMLQEVVTIVKSTPIAANMSPAAAETPCQCSSSSEKVDERKDTK